MSGSPIALTGAATEKHFALRHHALLHDSRSKFREERIRLDHGSPQSALSALMPADGCQLRHSPVGFRSSFHCTTVAQWVFILAGQMEIGLQDGTLRIFVPGEHFYSADLLPQGQPFDPFIHGHGCDSK